jgi:hypothetical protein
MHFVLKAVLAMELDVSVEEIPLASFVVFRSSFWWCTNMPSTCSRASRQGSQLLPDSGKEPITPVPFIWRRLCLSFTREAVEGRANNDRVDHGNQ